MTQRKCKRLMLSPIISCSEHHFRFVSALQHKVLLKHLRAATLRS